MTFNRFLQLSVITLHLLVITHGILNIRKSLSSTSSFKTVHGLSKIGHERYNRVLLASTTTTSSSYTHVENNIRRFIRQKKWADALESSSEWAPPSGNLTRTATYVIVETCRRSNSPHQILELLRQLPAGHFEYTREDDIMPYLSDLGGYSNCTKENGQRARELISYLSEQGVKFTAKTFSVLLKKCVSDYEDIVATFELFLESNISADVILLNGAMDAYIRTDRLDEAVKLFQVVTSTISNPPLPERLLSAFINNNDSSANNSISNKFAQAIAASSSSSSSSSNQVRANVRTVNTLMKGLRSKLDVGFQISLKLLRWMISNHAATGDVSMKPDTITINTLVDAAILAGRLSLAEDLLTRPLVLEVLPGVEAFTALIRAHASEGDGGAGIRVYNLMLSREVQPNDLTENAYISSLIASRKLDTARQILHKKIIAFESSEATESTFSLKMVFSAYILGTCKLFHEVDEPFLRERLLDESQRALVDMDRLHIMPDVRVMNAFLDCIGDSTRPYKLQEMVTLVWLMVDCGISPDEFSYNSLFSALGKGGAVDTLVRLLPLVKNRHFVDTVTVNSFMRGLVSTEHPLDTIDAYYRLFNATKPDEESAPVARPGNSNIVFQPTKVTFTILFLAIVSSLRQQDKTSLEPANPRKQLAELMNPPSGLLFSDTDGRFYERSKSDEIQTNSTNNSQATVEIDPGFAFLVSENTPPSSLPLLSLTNGSYSLASIEICSSLVSAISGNSNNKQTESATKLSSYSENPDVLLKRLYRDMRFRLQIEPDEVTFTVLKTLFSLSNRLPRPVISKETAILVFEDLVLLNFNPSQVK